MAWHCIAMALAGIYGSGSKCVDRDKRRRWPSVYLISTSYSHKHVLCCLLFQDEPTFNASQLLPGANQLLHFGELVVIFQALRVGQRPTRLDNLPRDNLFDGQLDLLEVDGRLCGR